MHPAIRRMGFQGLDEEHADSFLRSLQHRGRSEGEALAMLESYVAAFGPNANVGFNDAAIWLDYAAKRNGWGDDLIDAAYGWHSANGGDPSAIAPLTRPNSQHVQTRLAEIDDLRKRDLRGYFQNQAVQDEEIMLLSQAQGSAGGAPAQALLPAPTESTT